MGQNKHGEGSVFVRKDGRWVARITLPNGKKKTAYCKSEKEAERARRKMLNELEQGTLATGPQQLLKVYLEQWIEQAHKSSIRVSSYNMYRIAIHKHINPSLGHIMVHRLTPQQVQAFYTAKLDEGLSAKRVRGLHSILHVALDNAVKWGLVGKNVCDLVNPPVPQRSEIQPLTLEQAQKLLLVAQNHQLKALITLAVTTGMRRGELLGLHWQDVDFQSGTLVVRRSVGRYGKFGMVVSEPKTTRSRRQIVLPSFVLDVLRQHKEDWAELREKAGERWREMDIVFCNLYGDYIEATNLQGRFKQLLKVAELPNIRFHDLRHSAATLLLGMGIHPKIVQELLGHSSISMTMDVYSHVLPSMQHEAMSKLDGILKPKELD